MPFPALIIPAAIGTVARVGISTAARGIIRVAPKILTRTSNLGSALALGTGRALVSFGRNAIGGISKAARGIGKGASNVGKKAFRLSVLERLFKSDKSKNENIQLQEPDSEKIGPQETDVTSIQPSSLEETNSYTNDRNIELFNRNIEAEPKVNDDENTVLKKILLNLVDVNKAFARLFPLILSPQKPKSKVTSTVEVDSKKPKLDSLKKQSMGFGIVGLLLTTLPLIIEKLKGVYDSVIKFIDDKKESVKTFLEPVFKFATETVPEFFTETIPDFFMNDVPNFFSQKLGKLKNKFEGFLDPIKKLWATVRKSIGEVIRDIGKSLSWTGVAEDITKYGEDLIKSAQQDLDEIESRNPESKKERKKKLLLEQADKYAKQKVEKIKAEEGASASYRLTYNEEKDTVNIHYEIDRGNIIAEGYDETFSNTSSEGSQEGPAGTSVPSGNGDGIPIPGTMGSVSGSSGEAETVSNDGSSGIPMSLSASSPISLGAEALNPNDLFSPKSFSKKPVKTIPSSKSSPAPVVVPETYSTQFSFTDVPDPNLNLSVYSEQLFYFR